MTERDLTGLALRRRVADAYRRLGATRVEHDIELAGNHIDVYVELPVVGETVFRLAVEVKDWARPVGIAIVRDFAQVVDLLHARRLVHEGVIVGASGFSKAARSSAATRDIHLLEPIDLYTTAQRLASRASMPDRIEVVLQDLDDFARSRGRVLERRVADAYRRLGATKVEHDIQLAGNQIDVYVELPVVGGIVFRMAVEVKAGARPVGVKIVNDFARTVNMLYERRLVHKGAIVSVAGFSRQALDAAEHHGLESVVPAELKTAVDRRIPDPQNVPTDALRELLRSAFNSGTLRRFCEDREPFRSLRYRFGDSDGLDDIIDEIFEFCRVEGLWEELLDGVAAYSPRYYNLTAARMGWPQVDEPGPVRSEPAPGSSVAPSEKPSPWSAPLLTYDDVEIHVTGDSDRGYVTTIRTALTGDASGALRLPWDAEEQSEILNRLEQTPTDREVLVRIGRQLFAALLNGKVRDLYIEAMAKAGAGLRLRLWFDAPELQALPWELLYDAGRDEFLALSGRVLVTRYLSVPKDVPRLAVEPPLRILIASAAPVDQPSFDVGAEEAAIRDALSALTGDGLVHVSTLRHAQPVTLHEMLRDETPHVLHFSGHCTIERDGGVLILEDNDGLSRPFSGSDLGAMLKETDVRLAVLNACLTARGGPSLDRFGQRHRAMLRVGPALVQAGLGAVVAMQFSIRDTATLCFVQDFYRTVARGEPVDLAVSRAREALMLEFGEDQRDWATPVLFLRAADGIIFFMSEKTEATFDLEGGIAWQNLYPPAALWADENDIVAALRDRLQELGGHAQYNAPILIRLSDGRVAPTDAAMLRKLAQEEGASILERSLQERLHVLCPQPWSVESQGPAYAEARRAARERRIPVIVTSGGQPVGLLQPPGRQRVMVSVSREDFDLFDDPLSQQDLDQTVFVMALPSTTVARVALDLKVCREPKEAYIVIEMPNEEFRVMDVRDLNREVYALGSDAWGASLDQFEQLIKPVEAREWRMLGRRQSETLANARRFLLLTEERNPVGLFAARFVLRTALELEVHGPEQPHSLFDVPESVLEGYLDSAASSQGPIYDLAVFRELLLAAFTSEDLRLFLLDRPAFQRVVDSVAWDQALNQIVTGVIRHCQTNDLLDELLSALREERSQQYIRFEPRLRLVVSFELSLVAPEGAIQVGREWPATIRIRLVGEVGDSHPVVTIPRAEAAGSDFNIQLSAPAFEIQSPDAASLPLDPLLNADLDEQSVSFILKTLEPGMTIVTVEAFHGEVQVATLRKELQVVASNPFFERGRVTASDRFFNRQQEIRELQALVTKGESVSLVGERGTGKSSLLWHLYDMWDQWLGEDVGRVAYVDCQGLSGADHFYATLLDQLGVSGEGSRALLDAAGRIPIVLLLDEVERLAELEDAVDVLSVLRSALQRSKTGSILASSRRLSEFEPSTPVSPLSSILHHMILKAFDLRTTQGFLTERLEGTGVAFEDGEIVRLHEESQGNPRLLAELAATLYTTKTGAEAPVGMPDAFVPGAMLAFEVSLVVPPGSVQVGEEWLAAVRLRPAHAGDGSGYLLEVPADAAVGGLLTVVLSAPGVQFRGEDGVSLPLEADPIVATREHLARFRLVALKPGQIRITADLYWGDLFETSLEAVVEVSGLDRAGLDQTWIVPRPRPVPQPDLVFQVRCEREEAGESFRFHYHLQSFRPQLPLASGAEFRSGPLPVGWVEQVRGLLGRIVEGTAGGLPEDIRPRLATYGRYLYENLFPVELQTILRALCDPGPASTLLILADADAWPCWELAHDGRVFLGARFVVGRWPRELDEGRHYEFPVGAVSIAHSANVQQTEMWESLLQPLGAPPPILLPGGLLDDLGAAEAMRGLHLLHVGAEPGALGLHEAPDRRDGTGGSVEGKVRPARLNLRRNRPLVSLGYISGGRPELTALEQTWAPAFVRARCSVFVGPLWAVNPEVDAAFFAEFYSRLWQGDSLGDAFRMGRLLTYTATPDSLDGLAYILFGDPMARPYRPTRGNGYTEVRSWGREMDDPVPPGNQTDFQIELCRAPPVWHKGRLVEVIEELDYKNLQVWIVAPGLGVRPPSPVPLKRTSSGDYVGWFTVAIPPTAEVGPVPIQLYFAEGGRSFHDLTFALTVGENGGEVP